MIKIEIEVDSQTADVNIRMPHMALVKLFQVITDKILPEDLANDDSLGETVLIEFIRCLLEVNNDLRDKSEKHEVENAVAEAQKIVNPDGQE